LQAIWGGTETLVDSWTGARIFATDSDGYEACGSSVLNALLKVAQVKAGLAKGFWSYALVFQIYQVLVV